jgi:hypothetical protein
MTANVEIRSGSDADLEESRGSCNEGNDRRIDRPLLPEWPLSRPLAGRLVSGTLGQAGVCGDLWPGRVSDRLPHAGHQRGHGGPCGSHRGHGNWCGARPDTGPEPLLPQATAVSKRGGHGRCPVGMATPTAHAGTGVDCRRHRRTPPLWPSAVPSRSGHRGRTTAASGICPTAAVARGTGRRIGGRWWDAASAGGHERAGRSDGRGAGRGQWSWLVG